MDSIIQHLSWAEEWVQESGLIAGTSNITLADLYLYPVLTQFLAIGVCKATEFPNLIEWIKSVRKFIEDDKVNREAMNAARSWAMESNAKKEQPIDLVDNTKYIT